MRYLSIILILILVCGCSGLKYTKSDKILTTTLIASQIIDTYQTDVLSNSGKFEEGNPVVSSLFGKQVEWHEIAAFKSVVMLPLYYFYVYKAPSYKNRTTSLWVFNIISFVPVVSNSIVGAEVLFRF